MLNEKLEAAHLLVSKGVDPHIVAASLQLPAKDLKTLEAHRTQVTTELSEEDKQLAGALRMLVWQAIFQATETMQYGHPDAKAALVRSVLQRSMGLVGAESTQRFDEMRVDFEKLLESQTTLPEGVHAQLGTAPVAVDDPDEGSDDREV